MISKAALSTETDTIAQFLFPWQLAVGVPGGVEAVPHAVQEWKDRFAGDPDRLALDFDETNAYNAVDRGVFLTRMQAVFPVLAQWLRWIYPTQGPTWVYWKTHRIPCNIGGHQGCPLMGLCHAAVQRCIPECLGLAPLWPGTEPLIPALRRPPSTCWLSSLMTASRRGGPKQ